MKGCKAGKAVPGVSVQNEERIARHTFSYSPFEKENKKMIKSRHGSTSSFFRSAFNTRTTSRGGFAMKDTIIACAIGLAALLNGAIGLSASEDNSTLKTFSTAEKATSMKIGGGNKEGMGAGDPGVVVIQNKVTFGKAGKLTNNSRIDTSTGKASAGNTVHLGTISITDVIIDGKVSNEAKIRNSENIAIGEDSVATMGSVSITGGAIGKSGRVSNKTTIDSSRNVAMGKSNTAGMGSVIMNTAKVDGKVENRSQLETATNITSGENNTAGVGTTTLHNSKLGKGGTILNTSDTRKSANIGMGINNKTHAGAVQVE